jgi:hypothetical protein
LEGREIFRLVIPLRDRLITKLAGGSPANCEALRSGFGPSITIFLPRRTRKTPIVVDNTIIYWQPIVTNRSMVKNGRQVGGNFQMRPVQSECFSIVEVKSEKRSRTSGLTMTDDHH